MFIDALLIILHTEASWTDPFTALWWSQASTAPGRDVSSRPDNIITLPVNIFKISQINNDIQLPARIKTQTIYIFPIFFTSLLLQNIHWYTSDTS